MIFLLWLATPLLLYHRRLFCHNTRYVLLNSPQHSWGFKHFNNVWGTYLQEQGFTRSIIPNICPDCYTVAEFCLDNPKGKFILATGTHVIAVIDGYYLDTWDSGNEVPIYYFERKA